MLLDGHRQLVAQNVLLRLQVGRLYAEDARQ